MVTRRRFSREFKLEAVKLVTQRGVSIAQAAKDLDVHVTLYPIQYRSEVEISGSVDIAVAGCSQQRRANSAGVSQSSAEWGRLSL